jgi:hypothetical protein
MDSGSKSLNNNVKRKFDCKIFTPRSMYVLLFLPYEVSNSFALWNAVKGALGRVWYRATIKRFLLVVCLAGYVKYSPSTTILLNTTGRIVYYRLTNYTCEFWLFTYSSPHSTSPFIFLCYLHCFHNTGIIYAVVINQTYPKNPLC